MVVLQLSRDLRAAWQGNKCPIPFEFKECVDAALHSIIHDIS